MERQKLPMEVPALEGYHEKAAAESLIAFDRERFGTESGAGVGKLRSVHHFYCLILL